MEPWRLVITGKKEFKEEKKEVPVLFSYFVIHRMLERHGIFPALFRKGCFAHDAFLRLVQSGQETQGR